MTARAHVNGSSATRQPQSPPVNRWYHLNLLQKFAVIFFFAIVVPVLLLSVYASMQHREMIREAMTSLVASGAEMVSNISRKDTQERHAIFMQMQQQSLQLEQNVLGTLKEQLIRDHQVMFEAFARQANAQAFDAAAYAQRLERLLETTQSEANASINRQWQAHIASTKGAWHEQTAEGDAGRLHEFDAQMQQKMSGAAAEIRRKTMRRLWPVMLGLLGLGGTLGLLIASAIIRPIKQMTAVAKNISRGNVHQVLPTVHSHDEISQLAESFHETTQYLQKIVAGAQKISEGEFTHEVAPASEQDALGIAFRKMTAYLQEISELAANISRGDLSQVVMPKSEADVLGNAVYRMTRYLQQIAQVARKVSSGNLSEGAQLQSEHDFLGHAFAEMIGKLRHLVAKIRAGADQLVLQGMDAHSRSQEEAASVEKISLSVEETSSSMNEMAATIQDVNERMKQLSSFIGESSSSIEELNSAIRQIVTHGEQLASASQDTSSSIQQISASMQQIAETAQHSKALSDGVRQDAVDGRKAVEMMINSMKAIEQMVTITADAILSVNKRTESISKILAVIKDMSDQTSLLSINASIIAKKSGERGREFNVIADRVRKLADQSNSSAKEIARIIRDVQKESSHAVEVASIGREKVLDGVKLAELAGKALDKIISGANESSAVVSKIADTTVEQTKISLYIIEAMEQVVEMVTQIKVATKEQDLSSSYIMTQAEQVLLLSQQVKQATTDQTDVVKHVSEAMDNIRALIEMTSERANASTEAALMLSQHADALKRVVSQFSI